MYLSLPRVAIILNLLPCDELPKAKSCFPISLQLLLRSYLFIFKDGDAGLFLCFKSAIFGLAKVTQWWSIDL